MVLLLQQLELVLLTNSKKQNNLNYISLPVTGGFFVKQILNLFVRFFLLIKILISHHQFIIT